MIDYKWLLIINDYWLLIINVFTAILYFVFIVYSSSWLAYYLDFFIHFVGNLFYTNSTNFNQIGL